MKTLILIGLAFLASVSAKMCWQNCSGMSRPIISFRQTGSFDRILLDRKTLVDCSFDQRNNFDLKIK